MTQIAQHLRKYMVSMVFRYYRLDRFSMRYMVPLTSFTRQLNSRVDSQNLTSSVIFSQVLSISSHISENLSDPRLFKYKWIMHFMECKLSQDGQNSWHMRPFLAPKCLILAPFSYPKIIFRKNVTTISIIFS